MKVVPFVFKLSFFKKKLTALSRSLSVLSQYTLTIECPTSLGDLVMVELDKQALVVSDDWFCAKVIVVTPEKDPAHFPCYRISDKKVQYFRDREGQLATHTHTL